MSYRRTRNFTMNFQGTLLKRTRDFIGTSWGHCWDVAVISILGNECELRMEVEIKPFATSLQMQSRIDVPVTSQ